MTAHDAGNYTCRAYNTLGEAETSNELSVISKENVIYDSQHPEGLQQISRLEETKYESERLFQKRFTKRVRRALFTTRYVIFSTAVIVKQSTRKGK